MQANAKHLLPGTPPLLNAAALLLWGWQSDFLLYAAIMAVALEISRFTHTRLNLTDNEFNHISDLSAIIFLLVCIYIFITYSYHGIFRILSLLPFLFYLLILAQLYSTQGYIRASALFISLRHYGKQDNSIYNVAIDLSYPYFFICLLAASEGNRYEVLFYPALVIITGWALWSLRPARASMAGWVIILVLAVPTGFATQAGLRHLQSSAESTLMFWLDQFMWRSRDPQRTSTAIGTLGKLKLSDRIALRVDTETIPPGQMLLLRESSYLNYRYGIWTNYQNTMQLVDPDADGNSWIINSGITPAKNMTISFHLDDEAAIIPVPRGLHAISNVTASEILHSPYGATSLELNPGWIKYDVSYNPDMNVDSAPGVDELDIPEIYHDELKNLAQELDLHNQAPAQAVETTKRFFLDNFEYSLSQRERYPRGRYLSKFLFETRRGHCEFFATATALLLRAADIPTRYVVGYAINEYSRLEGQYIGRASHAHSWAQAYVDGKWITVDTTPPVWFSLEQADSSAITPLVDLWAWLAYKLEVGGTDADEESDTVLLLWILLPVLLFYLWRIIFSKRSSQAAQQVRQQVIINRQGEDSPFYRLCNELEKIHGSRSRGQTLQQWLSSLAKRENRQEILSLLQLHYRYRFDPDGLDDREIRDMDEQVNKAIQSLYHQPT